jgi:uncharacterized membrane protein YGL010W
VIVAAIVRGFCGRAAIPVAGTPDAGVAERRTRKRGAPPMTKTELFTEYGAYHADGRNRACHAIGIPLILLGTMGLLHLVALGPIDLAIVGGVATLIYYATIDLRGALISTILFAIIYEIAIRLPWEITLAALVIGWVFQLVGHRFEGTKPKFLENLVYLLIGPLYFFEETFDAVLGVTKRS